MQAVAWVAKRALRRRATELAGVALVVALGIGTTLAALSIAWRTERAYPDYLRRADVGELVVNPSLTTDRIQQVIASTPGVLDVVSDHTFLVTVDDEAPRARREVNGNTVQIRSSKDGRYVVRDRPVVHRGRMLRGEKEAFLSVEAAAAIGVDVGDELPVAFWQVTPNNSGVDPEEIIEPIGISGVRVVGVGVFFDEVLPDELYPEGCSVRLPWQTGPASSTLDPRPAQCGNRRAGTAYRSPSRPRLRADSRSDRPARRTPEAHVTGEMTVIPCRPARAS